MACRSWPQRLSNLGLGLTMDFDADRLLVGSLRCRRDRDLFWSIGPSPNLLQPNPEPPTYVMKFCPVVGHQEILVLANEDGKVAFQNTSLLRRSRKTSSSSSGQHMKGLSAHSNAIFDLSWSGCNVERIVTVSGDQTAKLWDLSSAEELRCIRTFRGHQRSVKVAEFQPGSSDVFATASRDNTIRVWDSRDKSEDSENIIRNAHKPMSSRSASSSRRNSSPFLSTSSSVTAIKFQDEHTLISCGDKDGAVKVWDLRRSYKAYTKDPVAKFQFAHPGDSSRQGFTSLAVEAAGQRFVYASCMDNKIYQYDLVACDAKPTRLFLGCDNSSFYVRISLSSDDQYLASGSRDTNAYVWNTRGHVPSTGDDEDCRAAVPAVPSLRPVASLEGHSAEVTCVDWCRSQWRLATCADDVQHRIWELDRDEVDREDLCGEAVMTEQSDRVKGNVSQLRNHLHFSPLSTHASFLTEEPRTERLQQRPRRGVKRARDGSDKDSPAVAARSSLSSVDINSLHNSPQKSPLRIEGLPCSPSKMNVTPKTTRSSPRKMFLFAAASSPTSNLPNFVRDGHSPSTLTPTSRERSMPKKALRDNWLVTLSRQKKKSANPSKENVADQTKSKVRIKR